MAVDIGIKNQVAGTKNCFKIFLLGSLNLSEDYCFQIVAPKVTTFLSIFFISPCSTFPGPTSVKDEAPSFTIFWIVCVQRTGEVSCDTRFF